MSNPVYVSKVQIERRSGPLRIAHLPGESQPVFFSVHGAIAEHYGLDPAKLPESLGNSVSKGRLSRKLQDKRLRDPNYAPQMKRTACNFVRRKHI
jgi:hypothetical protein